jgi:phage terminase small subunit
MALNARQQLFAEEYAANPNATKAAIAAGYSERSAGQIGERLLRNDEIASAVEKAKAERLKRIGVNGDRVLEELARLAFLDVRKLYNADGSLKRIDELDEDVAAAIAGLEVVSLNNDGEQIGTLRKIKLADKLSALEKLGKYLGLFKERVEVSGDAKNPLVALIAQVQGSSFRPVPQVSSNNDEAN